jgi:hypothetical protein
LGIAYSALGFLPALVVHTENELLKAENKKEIKLVVIAAYLLSSIAAILFLFDSLGDLSEPSIAALRLLTFGYVVILVALFILIRAETIRRKTIWMATLAVFTIFALHLGYPRHTNESRFTELIGHQSSLLLGLAILYLNFRFAFADIFLKRALSLLLLSSVVLSSYIFIAEPLTALHSNHPQPDSQSVGILLIFWIATALIYPGLHKFAVWFVDRIILRRANYAKLHSEIIRKMETLDSQEIILEEVQKTLKRALTAGTAEFCKIDELSIDPTLNTTLVTVNRTGANILIPTTDRPQYILVLEDLLAGRHLLSDEIEMLENVAWQIARRIDLLRVTHERCERELREQEFSSLATEAELRALRAQINPHFLFNALTTIGYLIQRTPDRALQTLMQLTSLLRGVLRSASEFQTLSEEIKLIKAYLEIERARFEERLGIEIEIDPNLLSWRIPSLILQPLVENAIKHGITPKKEGGTVRICARNEGSNRILEVTDTGLGIDENELRHRKLARVGLNNIEQRLNLYFDNSAELVIRSEVGCGTTVRIQIDNDNLTSSRPRRPKTIGDKERVFIN